MALTIPAKGNAKLEEVVSRINRDPELNQLWRSSNIMAIDRMGFNDHGPTHVKIIANIALKLLRLFVGSGRKPNLVSDYGLSDEDAEVVVVLGSLLHDIGHVVHRLNHEEFAVILAPPIIDRVLGGIYNHADAIALRGEILHCIISHKSGVIPQTLEAGIVKVADALDMEHGRARIPFRAGSVNIHSVSAMAIHKVEIRKGTTTPVELIITMSNSAGIFQIDNLLREKIHEAGLKSDLTVTVSTLPEERRIIGERLRV